MVQDEARSGSRPVPVELGWSSRLYRFWSSQMDSFTELASGSRVSTLTALAMTSVLPVAPVLELGLPPRPLGVAEPLHPAAAMASAMTPALRIRDRVARNIARPLRRLSTTWPNCRNVPSARQYSASVRYTLFTGRGLGVAQAERRLTRSARARPDGAQPAPAGRY